MFLTLSNISEAPTGRCDIIHATDMCFTCHRYKRGEIKGIRVARQKGCSLSIGAEQNILVNWCGQLFLPGSYNGIISDHNVSGGAEAFFETGHSPAITSLGSNGKALYSRFILCIEVAVLVGR